MDRNCIFWLHNLGGSGTASEPVKTFFSYPEFKNTEWLLPSAPSNPVTCEEGRSRPSWFDMHEIPVKASSPKDEPGLLKAVQKVHKMIDREIAGGMNPNNIFVCGFSQGGALALASVLLYPKTLGGGGVFTGWVPFNDTVAERFPPDALKTPIFWTHGIDSRVVLLEAGQAGPSFLEKIGVKCEFEVYPGIGHSVSTKELLTLETWIKARLQSSPQRLEEDCLSKCMPFD